MGHELEGLLEKVEFWVGILNGRAIGKVIDHPIRTYEQLNDNLSTSSVRIFKGGDLRDSSICFPVVTSGPGVELARIYHIDRGKLYLQARDFGTTVEVLRGSSDIHVLRSDSDPFVLGRDDVLRFMLIGPGYYVKIQGIYRFDAHGESDLVWR